jgi:O-antigen/teichoic acid export membrane protein
MGAMRTIAKNVASNAVGYLVTLVLAILVTPLALHSLGDAHYGVWVVIVSVTGYYGILDLGIRSAVSQYVTRHWSRGDKPALSRTLSTALAMTSAIAVLLIGCTILLALFGDSLFAKDGQIEDDLRQAVLVIGIGVALSFPLAIFGGAIQARERFDLANAIGVTERIVTNGLYVWFLRQGHGIVALAWITTGMGMLAHLVRAIVAMRLLPGVELAPRHVARASLRELFGFGVFSFLVSISDRLVLYTDTLVIQLVLGEIAVTYYSLGSSFIHHYLGLINAVAWTLTPHATALDSGRDLESLRRVWLTGSRLILLLATIIGAGLMLLGADFLAVWADPKYLLGEPFISSAVIMSVLALAALLRSAMACGKQVLYGMREVRFLARLSVAEAIANVVLSIPGAYWLGNLGVALGTLLPAVFVHVWVQPRHLARRLETTYGTFLLAILPPSLIVFGAMGLARWGLCYAFSVTNWPTMFAMGSAVTAVGVITAWTFGLRASERSRILTKLGLAHTREAR